MAGVKEVSSDFLEREGGIAVRDPKKGFQPVNTPVGYTDKEFRMAVAGTYTFYRQEGKLPSATDLHKLHSAIDVKTYSGLMLSDEFKQALAYRGIEWNEEAGLSLEQQSVLLKLQDFTDRRSIGVKLGELGVPVARYQAWLKHPLFRKAMNDNAEALLQEAVAPALTALAGKAAAGEDRAIEKVLEISGRWNPNAQSVEDARVVVMTLVEAIIKYVPDPEVRAKIMSEVSLTAGTMKALNS
jgi:hypothetical protein